MTRDDCIKDSIKNMMEAVDMLVQLRVDRQMFMEIAARKYGLIPANFLWRSVVERSKDMHNPLTAPEERLSLPDADQKMEREC